MMVVHESEWQTKLRIDKHLWSLGWAILPYKSGMDVATIHARYRKAKTFVDKLISTMLAKAFMGALA